MDYLTGFFEAISKLHAAQLVILLISIVIVFFCPSIIKRKYLVRNKIAIDDRIEDRNSWIFFPPGFNFFEKFLWTMCYLIPLILIVFAVNFKK